MKKTQVALAALALVASTAALADVKMYGAADITVVRTKAGTVISPGDNVGSIFGIAASEDLGGGLKAGANLELGFNPGDGLMRNGGTQGAYNAVFNRAANVSIGTNDLTVKAGLQFSPFIGALAAGLNAVGGNGLNVPAMGVLGSYGATNPAGGFFIPNAVSVDFNAGGFNGTILRSVVSETGPTAADATKGSQLSAGSSGAYTAAKASTSVSGINLTFGYESDKNLQAATPVDYNIYAIMASMPLTSELTINGGYTNRSQGNGAAATATSQTAYTVGASYQISQPWAVGLNYTANNATAKSTMLGLGTRYNFSKATALYLNYAKFENNVSGILQNGGNLDDPLTPYNSTAIGLGLSHSF
jgi:predicted porin